MYSLKVFLVSIVIVCTNRATADPTTPDDGLYELGDDEPEAFNPEEYKQYLRDLKCIDVVIRHGGTQIPEYFHPSSIYNPTTATEHSSVSDGGEETEVIRSKRSTDTEAPAPANTTLEVISTSEVNSTDEANSTEPCTAPLMENVASYNWYQILLNNGGEPGSLNMSGPKPNLTKAEDPCSRPLRFKSRHQDKVWYITKTLQPEQRVYREERVSLRFPDTPHEFVDVRGLLVWSPPGEEHRSYHISYRKDDTGLYVHLERGYRCRFNATDSFGVKCEEVGPVECFCEDNGLEKCIDLPEITPVVLSPGLVASLAGGGK